MIKLTNHPAKPVLAISLLLISKVTSASMLNLTNLGYGSNLGHSQNFSIDGIGIKLSAWGTQWDTNKNLIKQQQASISSWGNYGLGIQSYSESLHGYPEHTADNQRGYRDSFLVEFSQDVLINKASITEWGNTYKNYGEDSDNSFGVGDNPFNWSSLGNVSYDNVSSDTYYNGQRRDVTFNANLDSINWLAFGPSIDGTNDAVKLRNVDFTPEVSQVPVPAALWLFGPGALGSFGYFSARKPKPSFYINTDYE